MKKLFLFLAMASTTMFVSCSSDDSDDNNGGGGNPVTSITLTASATAIELGQSVTLTVKDNNGADVSSTAVFYDGTTVITSPYTPATAGSHSITAKSGTLTSSAVVVTVTAPAPIAEDNSIFINGANNAVTNSLLVLWGGYAEDPNATEATHGLFSMLTFDNETGAKTGNFIDVEFIVAVDSEGALVFPTPTNAEYLDIYEVFVNGTEVAIDTQESGSLTLTDFPTAINMPHTFEATCNYNSGSSLEVNFSGNWLGFSDQSQARPSTSRTKSLANSSKKVLSRSEVLKNKAKFIASLKK